MGKVKNLKDMVFMIIPRLEVPYCCGEGKESEEVKDKDDIPVYYRAERERERGACRR